MRGNVLFFIANLIIATIPVYYIGTRGLEPAPSGWEYKDLITIILTALAVILAGLAISIGLLAIWGYNTIRDAAVRAAETRVDVALAGAEDMARSIAESVAARAAEAALQSAAPVDRTEDLAEALSKKDDGTNATKPDRDPE
jgi:hypothetical protein